MMRMQGMRIHTVSIRAHKHNPQKKRDMCSVRMLHGKSEQKKASPAAIAARLALHNRVD